MATRRKAKKKTAAKRKSSKRAPRKARVAVSPVVIPKITMEMPLDAKRVKQIQHCIEKGRLRIEVAKVDLATGRLGDGWLYD